MLSSWTWKPEKNETLKQLGRPTFEDVLEALAQGGFRDILSNANYASQKILIVMIHGYAHAVPFKIAENVFFLFTVYPSRAYQKKYGSHTK